MNFKLYYSNLPNNWEQTKREHFVISNDKYKTLLNKLKELPKKGLTIYFKNIHKLFVPQLIDNYKIQGIDFMDYFDETFKSKEYNIKYDKDIYVVYNIGLEKALNNDFSSKLLRGLIEQLKEQGKIVFVCSYMSYTEFYKKYQIEIVNKIQANEKEDEVII